MDFTEETKEMNVEHIDTEKVVAMYHNAELIQPSFDLYRLNSQKGRVYFRFAEPNNTSPIFYSGTGSLTKEIPLGKNLTKYIAHKGFEESEREFYLRMLYGSHTHTVIANYIQKGSLNIRELPDEMMQYFYMSNFYITPDEKLSLSTEIKKDMIAFQRWVMDCKVSFVFVEYPVVSELHNFATPIDIGAFATIKESVKAYKKDGTEKVYGDKVDKEVFCVINYKSGNIYESHGFQLFLERMIFLENYPQFTDKDVRMFSLAAKDWKTKEWDNRTKPYIFKDWTDKINNDKFDAYMTLAKVERAKRWNSTITVMDGELRLYEDPAPLIRTMTIKEIVESGQWMNYQKTSNGIPQ